MADGKQPLATFAGYVWRNYVVNFMTTNAFYVVTYILARKEIMVFIRYVKKGLFSGSSNPQNYCRKKRGKTAMEKEIVN